MKEAVYAIICLFIFFTGGTIGSFLNVLVYRIPRKLDFVSGRSMCPKCGHQLSAKDLVPFFSWLILKGRCRYCREEISFRYPASELITGLTALLCFLVFGPDFAALNGFMMCCILQIVAFVDHDTMEIPNGLVIAAVLPAVAAVFVSPEIIITNRLMGMVALSLPMLLLTLVIPGAFGGGDIKLMLPVGFFLGLKNCLFAGFVALVTGGAFGIFLLKTKRADKKSHFAFGPFLCFGAFAAMLFGDLATGWYLSLFL